MTALPAEAEIRADAHVPAEADDDVLEDAAPPHLDTVVGGVDGGVLPSLDGHQGELGALGHHDLHALGQEGGAGVVEDHRAPGTGLRDDVKVLGGGSGQLRVVAHHGQARGAVRLDAGGEREDGGGGDTAPGRDAGAVHGRADGADAGVVAGDGLDGHALGDVHGDPERLPLRGRGADGVEVEQGGEAPEGGEPPLLLAAVRHRNVGGVEGGGAIGPGGDVAGGSVGVGSLQRRARVVGEKVRH